MNNKILEKAVQDYIALHLNTDVNQIALAKSPFSSLSASELANQITSKKKSEKKLPTWFNTQGIYYPPALSIEQTSSEITAKYKSKLAKGNSLIDLTGGFGIDTYYFAGKISLVTHCEINPELSKIAAYNARVLKANNIEFKPVDGIELLKNTTDKFDTIYVDPARRAEKGKVFLLKDCTPDVVNNLDLLISKADRIIIKTAPLLDISAGLQELNHVSEIHVVSVKNECKELLWVIDRDYTETPKIIAVTLNHEEKKFSFKKESENKHVSFTDTINAGMYLYEPDTALLKTGAFNLIGQHYHLSKLHPQTQLYTSGIIQNKFPGRIFEIKEILSTGDMKKQKSLTGNVIVRNYPAKPEDLMKKYKIKPDKVDFLIFTKKNKGENIIIKASIIQYY
ncbi:class I SAM-dependent methyltransferase [Pedobacter rhodius]|uniref:THUMP-like domain-containing protein n=1 Tax=Pedobacter rhodius TaxID=3004098 RepID=A0ABT4KW11_9SPHI|nr:class I SAM-dependent methyltransferase [Pedobacter sp. SJ11]MCZ4223115.1 hypothetical protein [Pedobacter sp. SJ11]